MVSTRPFQRNTLSVIIQYAVVKPIHGYFYLLFVCDAFLYYYYQRRAFLFALRTSIYVLYIVYIPTLSTINQLVDQDQQSCVKVCNELNGEARIKPAYHIKQKPTIINNRNYIISHIKRQKKATHKESRFKEIILQRLNQIRSVS